MRKFKRDLDSNFSLGLKLGYEMAPKEELIQEVSINRPRQVRPPTRRRLETVNVNDRSPLLNPQHLLARQRAISSLDTTLIN